MSSTKGKGKNAKRDPVAETYRALRKAHGNIKQKCSNPKDPQYKNYGERGISFQKDWADDRDRFVADMLEEIGPKPSSAHSLDRIENAGNYESGNLRWGSKQEQAINRRSSATVLIKGTEIHRAELAKELGLRPDTLSHRLRNYPRSNPRVVKFEEYWLKHMSDTDRLPIGLAHNERRLVADMLDRLPDGFNLAPAVRYGLHCWEEFAEEAAEAGGLRTYPKEPSVEFFTRYIGTAVSFGRRKLAKVEAARARQVQAQLEREADARQELIEAEAMERSANEYFERLKQPGEACTDLSRIFQSMAPAPSGPESERRQFQNQSSTRQPGPKQSLPINPWRKTGARPGLKLTEPGPNSMNDQPSCRYREEDEDFAAASPPEQEEIIALDEPEPCN